MDSNSALNVQPGETASNYQENTLQLKTPFSKRRSPCNLVRDMKRVNDHIKDSSATCSLILEPNLDTLSTVQQANTEMSDFQDCKQSEIQGKHNESSSNLGSDSDIEDSKQNEENSGTSPLDFSAKQNEDDSGISPNLDSHMITQNDETHSDEPVCTNDTESPADLDIQNDDELNRNWSTVSKQTCNPPKSRSWCRPGMGQYRQRSPSPFMNRFRRLGYYAYPRRYMPFRYSSTEQYRHRDMYDDYDDYT